MQTLESAVPSPTPAVPSTCEVSERAYVETSTFPTPRPSPEADIRSRAIAVTLSRERAEIRRSAVPGGVDETLVHTEVVATRTVRVVSDIAVTTERRDLALAREELVIEVRDLRTPGAPVEVTRIPLSHEEAVARKRVVVTAEIAVRTSQAVEAAAGRRP